MVNKLTVWLILEPLLYSQDFMHLADLSRKLKMPHPTLRKYLNNFEKLGIIKKQIKGRLTMYKLNYENQLITDYIELIEKEKLIEKCWHDLLLREIASSIPENGQKALIFGSAAENTKKANDIDLLIMGKGLKDRIRQLGKKLGIEFHIIDIKSLDEVNAALKKEIINKHIIISGTEGLIKWMLKN